MYLLGWELKRLAGVLVFAAKIRGCCFLLALVFVWFLWRKYK